MPRTAALLRRSKQLALPFRFASGPVWLHEVELRRHQDEDPHGDLDRWPDPAGANARRSVFAQDLVIEGDATSGGPVDVHGKFIGSMRAPDIIAGSGRVEGSVVANDLSVLGAVSGTISARNVQLAPSAVVHADISHERIAIEAGAELEGRLQSRA